MINSRFYQEMTKVLNDRECSKRQLAFECGVNYLTFIRFFNPDYEFTPLSQKTKSRIHNHLGISYEVMDEYNEMVLKERGN